MKWYDMMIKISSVYKNNAACIIEGLCDKEFFEERINKILLNFYSILNGELRQVKLLFHYTKLWLNNDRNFSLL